MLFAGTRYQWLPVMGSLLVLGLAGCLGGSSDTGGPASVNPSTSLPTQPTLPTNVTPGTSDPHRHFHHYWGDRTEVVLFEGKVTLTNEPVTHNTDMACYSVGHREFTPEDDGNDAGNDPKDPPVNPNTERADTVFAGAINMTVELLEKPETLLGVAFKYKPANLNIYQPLGGCGIELVKGNPPFVIPVGPGQADPPHQVFFSRWKFLVMALHRENNQDLPTAGVGDVNLRITVYKGTEANLDPAHPDLYAGNLTYDLGCVEATVSQQVIAPGRSPKEPLTNIAWPYGRIVPLLTEKVTVKADIRYTGDIAGQRFELWFHGADTERYAKAPPPENGEYTIPDPTGILADPPYEDKSQWRFEIRPVLQEAEGNAVGEFEGTYSLCSTAHRDPKAVLT